MKVKLEYIWLDGYKPEPNLRSKVKVIETNEPHIFLSHCPEWSFDGSSTQQAEGHFSDCILKPVRICKNPLNKGNIESILVLCEVMNPDGTPHSTNTRALVGKEESDLWFGFEQEYTIMKDGRPLGFPNNGYPEPQGKYYCGVGNGQVNGREFVDTHMEKCIEAGLNITGTNAEVLLGQWEYQVFSMGKLKAGDDLWISRYILQQMSEDYGFTIEFHPKPVMGDWNGSGLHCNFSSKKMREEGGEEYFKNIFRAFDVRHKLHIENYGSDNNLRLTGKHETQSIDKFSWGVSDRGASIRVPLSTTKEWKGYVEDRRPASNGDPYKIVNVISEALVFAETINNTNHMMTAEFNKDSNKKFGAMSSDELLGLFVNDDDYELTDEMMESKANVPTEEIPFNLNSK
jgi:glutamine synthetase